MNFPICRPQIYGSAKGCVSPQNILAEGSCLQELASVKKAEDLPPFLHGRPTLLKGSLTLYLLVYRRLDTSCPQYRSALVQLAQHSAE